MSSVSDSALFKLLNYIFFLGAGSRGSTRSKVGFVFLKMLGILPESCQVSGLGHIKADGRGFIAHQDLLKTRLKHS